MVEKMEDIIIEVALPCPLHQTFEYLADDYPTIQPGSRVRVTFGRREVIGVVINLKATSHYPKEKLKGIIALLDSSPILALPLIQLAIWMAHYYHAPIGEVVQLFLPAGLRQGRELFSTESFYGITEAGEKWRDAPENQAAKAKVDILYFFDSGEYYAKNTIESHFKNFKNHRKALVDLGLLVEVEKRDQAISPAKMPTDEKPLVLSTAQQCVVDGVLIDIADQTRSPVIFIEGVTGSGKTAVYTEIARTILAEGKQVLMLVPEIGLTPQFVSRIEAALQVRVGMIHSQVTDAERLKTWRDAMLGRVDLVIGTRSSLFTPFARLGLLIIDEAHDGSYIQRDGVRYSAVNSAVKRASLENIPLILGSATPTYEAIRNMEEGRFKHYQLPHRVSGAMPTWEVVNCHVEKVYDGISTTVLDAIEATIERKEQVLLFLNRRGFSPVITCLDCGTMLECDHCSSYLNFHRTTGMLHCHHCATRYPYPTECRSCGGNSFKALGAGTQKIEKVLADAFPAAKVLRFDRDNVKNSRDLHEHLTTISDNEADIIVGTQMLAKGHDFPNITLVVLLNSDGLFFANDFRADEKLAQLLVQVSGRAGRGDKKGTVMVQTMFPEHALFHELPKIGYHQYAKKGLALRELLELPPFSFQILVQVEARDENEATHYLEGILALLPDMPEVEITPVIPNNLKRRQDYYRVHVILQSKSRKHLHQAAFQLQRIYEANIRHGIRLLLEVDPVDFS